MELKEILTYQNNAYFNDTDHFLLYYDSLSKYIVSKMEHYNGNWYTIENGIKGTSVLSINADKDLPGREIFYKDTLILGKFGHTAINNNLMVNWYNHQPKSFKEYGVPYIWNEPKNLELPHYYDLMDNVWVPLVRK